MMDKPELRHALRLARKALWADRPRHAALSHKAQGQLLRASIWRNTSRVLLYHAIHGEVDTALLARQARAEGKKLFLPRCHPREPGQMDLLEWTNDDPLLRSARGIPEPPPHCACLSETQLADTLIVVPGLAFDRKGYRLGYGGGYYDRLLVRPHGLAVGLTLSQFLLPAAPRDPWDKPVDAICTEEGLLWP